MDDSELRQVFSEKLDGAFPRDPDNIYKTVFALLVFWDRDDLGCEGEVRVLESLFRDTFKYTTEKFRIPYDHSQAQLALTRRVCDLLIEQDKEDNLLIFYYGGHGRFEERNRKAVWAATFLRDSPTIKWYDIQPFLERAKGNVLLVLDCCHAMTATRGEGAKMEILASSAMGVETPRAGDGSFTAGLMAAMKRLLKERGSFTVTQLHRSLLRLETGLQEQAQYCDLSGNEKGSLVLRPLHLNTLHSEALEAQATVTLTFTFLRTLDKAGTDEFTTWLKASAPRTISGVSVDRVVRKCKALLDVVTSNPPSRSDTALSTAVQRSHQEIYCDLQGMDNLVAMGHAASQASGAQATSTGISEWHYILNGLQTLSSNLTHTLKRAVLALNIARPAGTLENNPEIKELGISAAVGMRKIVLGSDSVQFPEDQRRTAGTARLEFRKYQPTSSPEQIESIKLKVQMIASLLNRSKRSDYRSLKCIDCFHSAEEHRFVLVFEIPKGLNSKPLSLHDVISGAKDLGEKGVRKFSLGKRFTICYELASAISEWHSIGWVHKNINSRQVLFFELEGGKGAIDGPYLGGFEYARPYSAASDNTVYVTNFEENVYRHPDRQDEPNESFKKIHDFYTLGVLMLEVGLNKPVSSFFPPHTRRDLRPLDIQTQLIRECKSRLGPVMGDRFRNATLVCLKNEFGVSKEEDDGLQTQLDASFREKVLKNLAYGMVL